MGKKSDKRPFFAPAFDAAAGDVQIVTDDLTIALQLQRRAEGMFLVLGTLGPIEGHPGGLSIGVTLNVDGVGHLREFVNR
jgi:hypothetical protein